MHYSLFDEQPETPVPTFEEFFKKLKTQSTKRSINNNSTSFGECNVCAAHSIDVYKLVRSCQCSPFKCEGHECSCTIQNEGQFFPVCSNCLAMCLWKNTNDFMKQNNRFRAKCPFCKADFCCQDIILFNFPEEKKVTTPNNNSNKNKKKKKKKKPPQTNQRSEG